jgi:hypothetical protein
MFDLFDLLDFIKLDLFLDVRLISDLSYINVLY